MTIRNSYLCVGGPYAGRRHEAEGNYFRAAKRAMTAAAQFDCSANPLASELSVDIIEYRTQPFHSSNDSVIVWAPTDQRPIDTLRMLLETYALHWKDHG